MSVDVEQLRPIQVVCYSSIVIVFCDRFAIAFVTFTFPAGRVAAFTIEVDLFHTVVAAVDGVAHAHE